MPTLSARKRRAIIDAAIAEFGRNGYQATNMDTIAATAEVSKRTVYNHFPSKQDLLDTIANQIWDTANKATQIQYYDDQLIHEQLKQLALNELALVSDPKFLGLVKVLAGEFIHNHALAEQTFTRLNQQESSLTLWMRQASEAGKLKRLEPEAAAQHFYSLIKAQAFWPQLVMGAEPIAESEHKTMADQVCTMFLSLYGLQV